MLSVLMCFYQVFTWGCGDDGQLGHGTVVKSGVRQTYEELTPRRVEALNEKSIVNMAFGNAHSAAGDFRFRNM